MALPTLPRFLRANEREQIQQAYARYARLASDRQHLLEHFKSRNALLKNSVSYFPRLTTLVSEQAPTGELLRSVGALSNTTLSLALRSDPALADAQRRAREQLAENARAAAGGADLHNLQLLLGHARTIAEQKAATDTTLGQILTLPMAQRRGELDSAYQRAYTRASHQARWLGLFVSALAVTLLALLACVGVRLRTAAKALSRSHDRLELAVAERTAELREEMLRRERMEIELRQAQKLEAVGQLASGIAHEINTPIQHVGDSLYFLREAFGDVLRVVEGYQETYSVSESVDRHQSLATARRLEDDVDLAGLRTEIPEAFERALDGARQVTSIVQAMKTFSHTSPDKAPLDLNQAIENTLTVARNEYRFVADLATELSTIPEVVCNAAAIRQVLLNLIVNAAHAIGDVVGKSGQRGRITIRTEHRGDMVMVAVTDTGTGIPEGIRDRIFDPFFTTKPPGKGSGQGLAISRSIVDQHGGRLWFRSTASVYLASWQTSSRQSCTLD
ncbi:MAG: domain S-box protein [Polyangiaceae bacterium]|nr:domain S-box protein [Polyangiaceae bacterium]